MHGAIEVEDYQMVPLLKAMRMPRMTLLLADDVGLGKTVEAGLVMAELVLQRRIQRILILTPASLRGQWQEEMQRKSSGALAGANSGAEDLMAVRSARNFNPRRTTLSSELSRQASSVTSSGVRLHASAAMSNW